MPVACHLVAILQRRSSPCPPQVLPSSVLPLKLATHNPDDTKGTRHYPTKGTNQNQGFCLKRKPNWSSSLAELSDAHWINIHQTQSPPQAELTPVLAKDHHLQSAQLMPLTVFFRRWVPPVPWSCPRLPNHSHTHDKSSCKTPKQPPDHPPNYHVCRSKKLPSARTQGAGSAHRVLATFTVGCRGKNTRHCASAKQKR